MQDTEVRKSVIEALEFEPSIYAANIGVAVEEGVVTLTGHVPTYTERLTAERIVGRVKGVRGVAQEIEVRPVGTNVTADDEIAKRAANILRWNTSIPKEAVRVSVRKGFLTLEGAVEWNYQKSVAENAVHGIAGVTGVSNQIIITPSANAGDVRQRIENALRRDAELDASAIQVKVADGSVTLEGRVDCYADRQIAERAAWSAPGVRKVEDRLRVG